MTNYENLKAAAQSLGDFCDNHEDCDGCTFGGWFALFKLISDIARNALAVMSTAKNVTTGTTYSAETGNGRIGGGSSDHEQ